MFLRVFTLVLGPSVGYWESFVKEYVATLESMPQNDGTGLQDLFLILMVVRVVYQILIATICDS